MVEIAELKEKWCRGVELYLGIERCEFCKRERPLILCGEYQMCYNCMIRLRNATPEMLDALEALYQLVSEVANPDAFDNGVYAPDGRCEGNVLAGKIIERARTAIVKAKGEENVLHR